MEIWQMTWRCFYFGTNNETTRGSLDSETDNCEECTDFHHLSLYIILKRQNKKVHKTHKLFWQCFWTCEYVRHKIMSYLLSIIAAQFSHSWVVCYLSSGKVHFGQNHLQYWRHIRVLLSILQPETSRLLSRTIKQFFLFYPHCLNWLLQFQDKNSKNQEIIIVVSHG